MHSRHTFVRLCSALAGVAYLGLTACSGADDDLSRFIEDTKKEPGGRVEPLPEVKPYQTFIYAAAEMRSPFLPSSPGSGAGMAGIRPDSKRNREFLEQFSLDTLKMVGTLKLSGRVYGLVRTKDDSCIACPTATTSARPTARSPTSHLPRSASLKSFQTASAGIWSGPPGSL